MIKLRTKIWVIWEQTILTRSSKLAENAVFKLVSQISAPNLTIRFFSAFPTVCSKARKPESNMIFV